MIYRALGKSGPKISVLSFGSMRWQSEDVCHAIIHRGLEFGMNYVDTSTGYVDGKSDIWTANAVRDRRSDIYFSSKSNWAAAPSADDVRRTIDARLKKLRLDYFDLYQLWGLGSMSTLKSALKKGGTVDGIRKAQADGIVRYGIGFTFHDPPDVFRTAVDSGEFISATVSYNLLKRNQEDLIAYAAERGVGVIIMNPLGGGVLGMAERKEYGFLRGPHSGTTWGALRFLIANPSITTAIVGYTAAEQVDENVRALERPGELTEMYRQSLIRQLEAVRTPEGNFCTGCGYCKDCPEGFNPTQFMKFMRDFSAYVADERKLAAWLETRYEGPEAVREALAKCAECGKCVEKCPQGLPILDEIRRAKSAAGIAHTK